MEHRLLAVMESFGQQGFRYKLSYTYLYMHILHTHTHTRA